MSARLRHVGPHRERGPAVGRDLVGRRLRAASSMSPPTIVAPAPGEHVRGRLADAARDAGEHRDLAREVEEINCSSHGAEPTRDLPRCRSGPRPSTRVLAMWERWPRDQRHRRASRSSSIGDRRFVTAPPHLRARLADPPTDLDALVARLGDDVERVVGIARLAYADDETLRARPTRGRLVRDRRRRSAPRARSSDVSDRARVARGVGRRAVRRARRRRRGRRARSRSRRSRSGTTPSATSASSPAPTPAGAALAGRAAAGAIIEARAVAASSPQWRSRVGNDASAAVADRLGFVPLGRQMFVRVRPRPA